MIKLSVFAVIITLSLITPVFAEVDTTFEGTCPPPQAQCQSWPSNPTSSTGSFRYMCKKITTAIVATWKEIMVDGNYVHYRENPEFLEDEYRRAQESLSWALNKNSGWLGALMFDEQVSWYKASVAAHDKDRNYDPTQVKVDGAIAPKLITEIVKCRITRANNSDEGYVGNWTYNGVSIDTRHDSDQTIVEYWAVIRDARTHEKLCDAQGQVLSFYGKSKAVNEDTSISIYGYTLSLGGDRTRVKDSNLDIAHATAGAALAADIDRQLKCYPL